MLRGQKVLLDRDLAELYGVLDRGEFAKWRSQFVISNSDKWDYGKTRIAYPASRISSNVLKL